MCSIWFSVQILGEYICIVLLGFNKDDLHNSILNILINKLVSDVHMIGLNCSSDILSHKYFSYILHQYYDGTLYMNLHTCK